MAAMLFRPSNGNIAKFRIRSSMRFEAVNDLYVKVAMMGIQL
jgi:hypothetical protein